MAKSDQTLKLKYFRWDPKYELEKTFQLYADIPEDAPPSDRGNVQFEGDPEIMLDIRGQAQNYPLNRHGFLYTDFKTAFNQWDKAQEVSSTYYKEMETLLKREVPGASVVHVFEHRLRRSDDAPAAGTTVNLSDSTRYLSPAGTVHGDLSPWEVLEKVKWLAGGDEALCQKLLRGRVEFIKYVIHYL